MNATSDEVAPPASVGKPRRRILTARRLFSLLAIVLSIVLAAIVFYLLYYLGRPEVLTGLPAVQGIQPIWQMYGPAEGSRPLFDGPMGVAIGKDSHVYVTDSGNNRVCEFDAQGRFVREFGTFGVAKPAEGYKPTYQAGSLNFPVGIDTDADGNVYVASFRNDSIEVFDAEGVPLRRFPDPTKAVGKGGSGSGGTGIAVTDVAVSGERVYATDAYQVVVFTRDGELLDQWGMPGDGTNALDHPNGIAVSADGERIYVSDSNHSRVTAFSPTGEVIWTVGKVPAGIDDTAGREIELPRGLTVLPDGSVLVADAFAFSLVKISPAGAVIGRYGERGVEPGQLNFSNDLAVLRGFVVLADKENERIQVVRLVH